LEEMDSEDSKLSISKKRVQRVTKACVNCQKSHLSCETMRPCKRCLERGKTCCDAESKRRGRKRKPIGIEEEPEDPLDEGEFENTIRELASLEYLFVTAPTKTPNCANFEQFSKKEVELLQNHPLLDMPPFLFNDFVFSMQKSRSPNNKQADILARIDFFKKCREMNKERCRDSIVFDRIFITVRDHLSGLKPCFSGEAIVSMRKEYETYISIYKSVFDDVRTPTIIWERNSVIQYVNKGWEKLTGFNEVLPTPLESLGMMKCISNEGWKNFMECMQDRCIGEANEIDSCMFSCGILVSNTDKFIQGTMSVTIRRDILGLPLLFLGNFLPQM